MTSTTEKTSSKLVWIVVGAIVGATGSLSFDKIVRPYFTAEPDLRFLASCDEAGTATFSIANDGDAAATDVAATVWAMSGFRAFPVDAEHDPSWRGNGRTRSA
jgi:hypothetical protein